MGLLPPAPSLCHSRLVRRARSRGSASRPDSGWQSTARTTARTSPGLLRFHRGRHGIIENGQPPALPRGQHNEALSRGREGGPDGHRHAFEAGHAPESRRGTALEPQDSGALQLRGRAPGPLGPMGKCGAGSGTGCLLRRRERRGCRPPGSRPGRGRRRDRSRDLGRVYPVPRGDWATSSTGARWPTSGRSTTRAESTDAGSR